MRNSIFVAIRDFEPERNTAAHRCFNLSDIHRRIVAFCLRVVNTVVSYFGERENRAMRAAQRVGIGN
jgi:hypothetical protein